MGEDNALKQQPKAAPLASRIMVGGAWMVATRWMLRILGLVNVVILARLLSPEDFGIVAMAMAFVVLADSIMNMGAESAVIQMGEKGRAYYNAAWTLRIVQNLALAAVICVLAIFAPAYYGDPRVEAVIQVVAITIVIRAFENIGVTAIQQELRFSSTFWQQVLSQAVAIVVTLSIAVLYRSYWALVIGSMARTAMTVILSFLLFPYRPRLEFRGWKHIWSFSQWYLVNNLGKSLLMRGITLTLGRVAGPGVLGIYSMAAELAGTAAFEIAMPISRVLYTGMVKLREDMERYRRAFLQALHGVTLITAPICFGLGAVSDELVMIALGKDWTAAADIMKIMAFTGVLRIASLIVTDQLVVLGQLRKNAVISWVQAIVLLSSAIPVYLRFGLEGVAWVSVIMAGLTLVYVTAMMSRACGLSMLAQFASIAGPFMAGFVMAAAVLALPLLWTAPDYLMLPAKIVLGVVVYPALALALWNLAGRPDGLERKTMDRVAVLGGRLKARLG
ncbi:lipopolysaccharide biosynthesis protein [Pedomonas sp. V897]|uniref:lipopolysaccharide biosynthesis protein n=1 Tax=Pedomonas sp. V897 TaxID=3446482 RepID=UPI003EE0FFDD